eukprot:2374614-Prymnesium_polylepis.1
MRRRRRRFPRVSLAVRARPPPWVARRARRVAAARRRAVRCRLRPSASAMARPSTQLAAARCACRSCHSLHSRRPHCWRSSTHSRRPCRRRRRAPPPVRSPCAPPPPAAGRA